MRQTSEDHALYLREIRTSLRQLVSVDVTSPQAQDALNIIDRLLVEYIVEEEHADSLCASFGAQFAAARGHRSPAPGVASAAGFTHLRHVRRGEVDADQLLAMARVERQFVETVDGLRVKLGDISTAMAQPSRCSVTAEEVTDYLRGRADIEAPQVRVLDLQQLPGGRSKETIVATLADSGELPPEIVIRKDRAVELNPGRRSADDFAVIKVAYEYGGIPCPRPLLAEPDADRLGGTLVVTQRVDGVRGGEYFADLESPATHRAELTLAYARALARVHTLPIELMAATTIDRSLASVAAEDVHRLVSTVTDRVFQESDGVTPSVLAACEWLLDHPDYPSSDTRSVFCQGDIGLHNSVIRDGEIAAMPDWELAKISPASLELCTIYDMVSALGSWDRFVAEYVAAGGSPQACDPRALLYYRLHKAVWGYTLSLDLLEMFRSGSRRDIVTAGSGVDSRFRHSRNVARAFDDVLALA